MPDDAILSIPEARDLARAAFLACGCTETQAAPTAAALVEAEIAGQFGHGLIRIPAYAAQALNRKAVPDAVPVETRLAPGMLRVDAGNGFAYPAWDVAIDRLPAMAKENGVAAACIAHSTHFGVAGLHAERLARAGCVALVFGNAASAMAPWGGKEPFFGTNPLGFAAPMHDGSDPLVIDMATSTVAKGKMIAMRDAGATHVPEGWALDRDGNPVTEIDAAIAGTVTPMAGAKGSALALMIEVLCACLCGGSNSKESSSLLNGEGPPPDIAQLVIAVDADLASSGGYAGRMADLMEGLARIEGARLPGIRRLEARARAAREGMTVPAALKAKIDALIARGAAPAEGSVA